MPSGYITTFMHLVSRNLQTYNSLKLYYYKTNLNIGLYFVSPLAVKKTRLHASSA